MLLPSTLITLPQAVGCLIDRHAPWLRQKVRNALEELQRLEQRHAEVISAFRVTPPASYAAPLSGLVILPPDFMKPMSVSRAPPPIRPLSERWSRGPQVARPQTELSAHPLVDSKEAYKKWGEDWKKSRMRLTELQTERAKLVIEIERWTARLAQPLCDAAMEALLLWDRTGDEIPIPAPRWRTANGAAALRTGRLALDTAEAMSQFLRNPASYSERFALLRERFALLQMLPAELKGVVVLRKVDFDRWMACLTPDGEAETPQPVLPTVLPIEPAAEGSPTSGPDEAQPAEMLIEELLVSEAVEAEPSTTNAGHVSSKHAGGRPHRSGYKECMAEAVRYRKTNPRCSFLALRKHVYDFAVDNEGASWLDGDEVPSESAVRRWLRKRYPSLK